MTYLATLSNSGYDSWVTWYVLVILACLISCCIIYAETTLKFYEGNLYENYAQKMRIYRKNKVYPNIWIAY